MKTKYMILLIAVAILLLAACQGAATPTAQPTEVPAGSTDQSLTGPVWKWTTTQMNDGSKTIPDDPNNYLIQFQADGTVSITADCNQVMGTYTVDANQVTITPGASTLVACPEGSLADAYLKQLGNVGSYFFQGENLVLEIKMDSGSMIFAPSAAAGLPGTSWSVVNYNNGKEAVVSVLAGTEISLDFGTDGTLSGKAGCNNYNGGFEVDGAALKVGALASTMMACESPEGVMDQEQQYLAALQNSATYEIAGNTLTIRDASGAMQVVAKSAD
jgi:heat shock protein HslJ